MKKYLIVAPLAAALCCGTSLAFARDNNTDISQVLDGVQKALNSIDHHHNADNIAQSATNAGNLINEGGVTLDDIFQFSSTPQIAVNDVSTVWGYWSNLTQEATNVVNSLDQIGDGDGAGVEVSSINQKVNHSADQFAINNADYAQFAKDVSQTAVNAANLATVRDVNEGITQKFDHHTLQKAENSLTGGGADSYVDGLAQAATNVANSITADDIENNYRWWNGPELQQIAEGTQLALNTVEFGSGTGGTVAGLSAPTQVVDGVDIPAQAGTNAVNLATIDALRGTSSQFSDVYQRVANTAAYTDTHEWGAVSGFEQTGMNAANILTANSLPSLNHQLEVSQLSFGMQSISNSLDTAGTLSNITQSATNVANSISLPNLSE